MSPLPSLTLHQQLHRPLVKDEGVLPLGAVLVLALGAHTLIYIEFHGPV